MDSRSALPSGIVLDQSYEIRRVLGLGGFGVTYEAFDRGLGRPVAVKEYYPAEIGHRQSTMSIRARSDRDRDLFDKLKSSFLREARTLSRFAHPAIVRVLRVFEAHGTAYMVMDLEQGPTLKAWLSDLGRSPTQAELDRLLEPLLGALERMHDVDFLHRDVAPDNIIVRPDGTPVLLDFGATRRVAAELSSALTGLVKRGYSPMEQYATDSRAQGPWTDIYALAATLYRCVTGREPQEATLRVLADANASALTAGSGQYRRSFLAAIDRALAIRPEERPQSVAEWRSMLLGGDAPALSTGEPAATAVETAPTSIAERRTAGQPVSPADATVLAASAIPAAPRKAVLPWRVLAGAFVVVAAIAAAYQAGMLRPLGPDASPSAVPAAVPVATVDLPAKVPVAPVETEAGKAAKPITPSTTTAPLAPAKPSRSEAVACSGIMATVDGTEQCFKTGEAFRDCSDCPEMVVVPAGSFMMGAPEDEIGSHPFERPVHKVTFAKPFAMGRHEITRQRFEAYLKEAGKTAEKGCTEYRPTATGRRLEPHLEPTWTLESHGYFQGATHPVVCVSWSEAKQFSAHLARATGRPYRLPTEAEWEYAARAGSSSRYFFGEFEVDLCDYGNVRDMGSFKTSTIQPLVVACRDGSRFTSAVGSFKPNAFGLYDTIGNVWEWVEDCRLSDYKTANADGSAPIVPDCKGRVARGGSWGSHGANVRSAIRWFGLGAEVRFTHTGFRVARSAD